MNLKTGWKPGSSWRPLSQRLIATYRRLPQSSLDSICSGAHGVHTPGKWAGEQAPVQNLEDLQPREVFQELCLSHELAEDETQRQLSTFGELLERHEEAKSQ